MRYLLSCFILFLASLQAENLKLPKLAEPADQFSKDLILQLLKDPQNLKTSDFYSDKSYSSFKLTNYFAEPGLSLLTSNQLKCIFFGQSLLDPQVMPPQIVYQFGYELQEADHYFLFDLKMLDDPIQPKMVSFSYQVSKQAWEEKNKFSLGSQPWPHYLIFSLAILVPLFIIFSFSHLLFSPISTNKKFVFGFLILLVAMPQVIFEWSSGTFDFRLLSIALLGLEVSKPTLYYSWKLAVNFPLGAVFYWYYRPQLLPLQSIPENY